MSLNSKAKGKRGTEEWKNVLGYEDFINGTIPKFMGKFTKRSSVGLWR